MHIKLTEIFHARTLLIGIDTEVDLTDVTLYGEQVFTAPVKVKGQIASRASVVTLSYAVSEELKLTCGRCLAPTKVNLKLSPEHTLVRTLESEDVEGYILIENDSLDLDLIVRNDVYLGLPGFVLCSENCKGLCDGCGVRLSTEVCKCEKKVGDPRFDVLRKLL